MNKPVLHALWLLLAWWSLPLWAQTLPPDVLARNVTHEVIEIVKRDRDIKSGNPQKIYALVDEKVLPHFDFRQMTQLAVGRNWAQASPEQQQRLTDEFRTLLVRTYASSLASVADYSIDFKPLRMRPGDTEVTVSTEVTRAGTAPVKIDYRMQLQSGGWKVYDVLVDNVSLVTTYRNSFNSEVRKGGIDGLIAALARRNRTAAN
ncbi:MAG: ABC transporter substrate-binding protein [Thiobacillaceae bacterium]|nr:ABC transporter substrate-binding protein [Thiobacillaceae bacterium]